MRVVFLGTNGWYDTTEGNTISIFVESRDYQVVFDAGFGFHKLDRYLNSKKPLYIFLSHFHLDHIVGLHTLVKFKILREIKIIGPKGTRDVLETIINKPFTVPLNEFPFEINIYELPDEKSRIPDCMKFGLLLHSSLTLGYRFEADGKILAYCPDTGYCENAIKLSRKADMLIADCAYKSGQMNEEWPHLNPEMAATIAVEAKVKKLALSHFDANIYRTKQDRIDSELTAKKIFPNTFSAFDDMEITL